MNANLRRLPALAATAALIVAIHAPALAQKKETPVAPAGAPQIGSSTQAQVEGFRSARFGMAEADVRAAILKDFNLKPDAIREQANPGERTKVLVIKAPDVLPGGGTAEVSYVIGYQTKKLIQVSVSWSKTIDTQMTPEQLFSNSSVLRAHFVGEGFKPDTIATNMPINGGILMFRGSDAKDRTVMMILQGTLAPGDDNQRVLTPTGLLLFYIADAKAPDVYRLPAGSF
ncbi:MAG: hypothetical protein HZA66_03860 [Rhodopseudomonas palustris]|uniref:Uncharacterized protein n=1 Tax=Rhodopseudomonas palustris TaxID=1076 RepID=A0A933VTC4_RHOPL|nr:hypothetical protein [Rhodopseudomonas palustris]